MVFAYDLFAKWMSLKWQRPIYKPSSKLPHIPLEREIDDLIAYCNQYIAAFSRIAKETGARAGENFNLKWIDVDFERQTIRITAEKGSNPRIFRMSNTLIVAKTPGEVQELIEAGFEYVCSKEDLLFFRKRK